MDRFMKYYVYVIRLSDAVLKSRKFRCRNPDMIPGFPCFYVGQSCHSPEIRFWQHKEGYKGNRFVKEFGLGLCPRLYESFNPIGTRKEAEIIEAKLTESLRSKGHGVWSN
jgi:predicted GIY-YIG superfamily endonuclease